MEEGIIKIIEKAGAVALESKILISLGSPAGSRPGARLVFIRFSFVADAGANGWQNTLTHTHTYIEARERGADSIRKWRRPIRSIFQTRGPELEVEAEEAEGKGEPDE